MNRKNSPKTIVVVEHLNAHDVLLGRGSGPNENSGNIKFRNMVHRFTQQVGYSNATRHNISLRMVQTVHANGGRFLRKFTKTELAKIPSIQHIDIHRDLYFVVSNGTALKKAKETIRFQLNHPTTTKGFNATHQGNIIKAELPKHVPETPTADINQHLQTSSAANQLFESPAGDPLSSLIRLRMIREEMASLEQQLIARTMISRQLNALRHDQFARLNLVATPGVYPIPMTSPSIAQATSLLETTKTPKKTSLKDQK